MTGSEQRRIEDEKRRFEKENPAYILISHPSNDPEGFSRKCSQKISLGYRAWVGYRAWGGMQIDPQGNFIQAFQRYHNSRKTKFDQDSFDGIVPEEEERETF